MGTHKPIPFPSNSAWTGCTRKSYNRMSDWVIIVCLALAIGIIHGLNNEYPHMHDKQCVPGRDTGCGQSSIGPPAVYNFPLKNDTVPFPALAVTTVAMWVGFFILNAAILHWYNPLTNGKWKVALIKADVLLRSVLKAFVLTILCVEIVKNWVGRPRPNYLNNPTEQDTDGARSFPSGHSAFSVSIGILLTLYIFRSMLSAQFLFYYSKYEGNQAERDEELAIIDEPAHEYEIEMKKVLDIYNGDSYMFLSFFIWLRHCQMVSLIFSILPFLAALYVCCTRLTDYKHHYSDVLGGAFIGMFFGIISFVFYYGEFYYGFRYDMTKILTDLGKVSSVLGRVSSVEYASEEEVDVEEVADVEMEQKEADLEI